tara:strand:- start:4540 stop:5253 length:714 start_codon:yes stop_codon:yes gene_type:complete
MSYVAVGSAAISIVGGIIGGGKAKKEARRHRKQQKKVQAKLNHLEANRQDVINPYDNVSSLAGMATDLSSTLSNPMANLSVATQAAEMQIEEADISLANTLDTLRATGSSAGGATALAQAALKSKKGVAAGIESQEAANEKARAQGEATLQTQKMEEKKRIQNLNISEGQRVQTAESTGAAFVFNQQEQRETAQMNRVAGQLDNAANNAAQANRDSTSAITGALGSMAQVGIASIGS